jgi:hypothetical protein
MTEITPTPNEANEIKPEIDILGMTRQRKRMSVKKLYNLYQGLVPENQENDRSKLGATTEAAESA